jgi:hypothetical protein
LKERVHPKNFKKKACTVEKSKISSCASLFCAAFTHGQNIVETCTLFGFSLFCPCCASLYLPQAALGFAPLHRKEKAAK